MTKDSHRFLVTDLEGTREKGFEYFKKSDNWPIEEREFHEFSEFVRNLYNNIIIKIDDTDISDIALADATFIDQIINIFHYNYARQYCLKENIELVVGNESACLLYPDWEGYGGHYSEMSIVDNKLKRFIRNKLKNFVFNRHLPLRELVNKFFKSSDIVGIGSNDRIKQEYIIKNKIFCDNRDVYHFIKEATFLFSKDKERFSINNTSNLLYKKIINPFIYELSSANSIFTQGLDLNHVGEVWLNRLMGAYKIYKGLFLVNMPKSLLVTETGKPHSKLITLVFQRRGCNVFNFHHGNSSALLNLKWGYQSLFSHCDNYVVDTEVMRIRFKELLNNQKNIRKKPINLISVDSNFYANLRNMKHSINSKKVMLMGYPMSLQRYAGAYEFFYYRLTLENIVAEFIKHSDYNFIYKVHPDKSKEIQSVMTDVSNSIIEKPFEDVWRKAGVLLYTYVATTTFGYALNLPIPIVLIEMPETKWYKNMREILEKRVVIIQAEVVDGLINIDRDNLINAINLAENRVNLNIAKEITG